MSSKRIYFNLFLIVLFGFLIRITCLDKPEGLWNDEYISWYISSKPLFSEFIDEIYKNCHMPFYYIYIKFWSFLFGDTDLSLRISSVISGILCIFASFYVGKELKDYKTGLLCAFLTSISGFMIYFSQEVRFYGLLTFFSFLTTIFFLKLLKNRSIINYIGFFISNVLVILTHTIGFVFVFFNLFFLFFYLKKEKQITYKPIIFMSIGILISALPLTPFMFKTMTSSYISQFWSDFSLTKLFFVLTDYISPIQINLINTPSGIRNLLFNSGKTSFGYWIFGIVPLFISAISIFYAFSKKNIQIILLSSVAVSTLFVTTVASFLGKIVLITKYTCEIYPAFILITAYGLTIIKPEMIRKFLTSALLGLSLFYILVSPYAPQKSDRKEGHKIVADLIKAENFKSDDIIILLYYNANRFGKYIDIENYNIDSVTKYNFQYKLLYRPDNHVEIIKNGKEIFLEDFRKGDTAILSETLRTEIFKNIPSKGKFALITLKSVSFIDEEKMKKLVEKPTAYKRMPLLFLVFSHISNVMKKEANKALIPVDYKTKGQWEIYVWKKR